VSDPHDIFLAEFGPPGPTHRVRVPGRVNLIGDHIDYAGLAVLPIALQRTIVAYVRARTDRSVRAVNADRGFLDRRFDVHSTIQPFAAGDWGNYLKAAVQGLERRYGPLRGFDAALGSTIPVASGLSSSSALVVTTGLCLAAVSGLDVAPEQFAEDLADAERYVGTRGGGMDQAICLSAVDGAASRVEFDPLRLTSISVPGNWRFVVSSSLVPAPKSGAARDTYNSRRQDSETALRTLSAHLGGVDVRSYRELVGSRPLADLLGTAEGYLDRVLLQRFRHVVTESDRVHRAEQAMRGADAETFGRLMSESHCSLRDDYAVSCLELDELVELAMSAGALGARLTGAGFGGCSVALCLREEVDAVMAALRDGFYGPRGVRAATEEHLFVATPSAGAGVALL
jgi:galactokinase